jgi:hypothetical protein
MCPCVGAQSLWQYPSFITSTAALGLMALMAVGSSSTVYIGRKSFDTEVISGRSRVEF